MNEHVRFHNDITGTTEHKLTTKKSMINFIKLLTATKTITIAHKNVLESQINYQDKTTLSQINDSI